MILGGTWLATAADEALRRAFPAPEFDDGRWEPLAVPGHWRSSPAFAKAEGPLLYRTRFEAAAPEEGRRSWLTLDGVFYEGDVWLDGGYVGATEGYFFPHTFEVTEAMTSRPEHVLAVEVGCPPPSDRTAKRLLTGVFQHWDCLDPTWNPGGIWRPVSVTDTGPVRIMRMRVLCGEASAERARLDVRAFLDAAAAMHALLRVTVLDADEKEVAQRLTAHPLAHGENRIESRIVIDNPALWWPHALGEQPLYDVRVEVLLTDAPSEPPGRRRRGASEEVEAGEAEGRVPSDVRTVRTGLRQVRMKNWVMTVNGERLFLKGSNQGPTRMALGEATAADLEGDVALAVRAGLDLLRVHGHVSRPELYDAADRHGLLLWQDLPLQWGYARTVRKQAVRQAREAVDLIGHHPSVAMWCGHNEPLAIDLAPGDITANPARVGLKVLRQQELPSWNKTVLDTSISRTLERSDPSRPVLRNSGLWPGVVRGATDAHLYFGWYNGSERDFPRALRTVPNLARFVTEFGAQAVPTSAAWMSPGSWPELDWALLSSRHSLQKEAFDRYVPPAAYGTFEEWQLATQAYQANVIRFHIEALRLLKYRPAGGFCHFCFADAAPAVTWSVLDHLRVPKEGFDALVSACAPVIVVATRPAASYAPGAVFGADVHIVSDLRRPIGEVRVMGSLGSSSFGWAGTVDADACVLVGRIAVELPSSAGVYPLSLSVFAGAEPIATNCYEVVVAPGESG